MKCSPQTVCYVKLVQPRLQISIKKQNVLRTRSDKGQQQMSTWVSAAMCGQSNRWHETPALHYFFRGDPAAGNRTLLLRCVIHLNWVRDRNWAQFPHFSVDHLKRAMLCFLRQHMHLFEWEISKNIFSPSLCCCLCLLTIAQWIFTILDFQECRQFSGYLFQYPLCTRLSFP